MHEFGAGHAALAAQHQLDTVLTGTAAFGRYTASAAHRLLTDLAVLASRILRTTEAPRAGDPDIGDLSEMYRTALIDTDGSGRRGRPASTAPKHYAPRTKDQREAFADSRFCSPPAWPPSFTWSPPSSLPITPSTNP
ncbi:hypothetical protein [Amycolatopsis sp. NPDC051371]|uniref:hypothetical protein n=1 Tax=Amycolatopsis sp. NPDC051371 TaxID=3155800 RepID=UPI00343CD276